MLDSIPRKQLRAALVGAPDQRARAARQRGRSGSDASGGYRHLAIPYTGIPEYAQRTDWTGCIVVDALDAINFTDFTPTNLGKESMEQTPN